MSLPRVALLVGMVSLAGTHASAQSLSELLPRLLSEAVTMPSTANVAGNPHEAHFLPAAAQLKAPYALNGAIVTQLSTFPLGSSSGGFTYSTDRGTGIPERSSNNFGPAFAERALTIGKGHFSAGRSSKGRASTGASASTCSTTTAARCRTRTAPPTPGGRRAPRGPTTRTPSSRATSCGPTSP
jgi:hypothetical protein